MIEVKDYEKKYNGHLIIQIPSLVFHDGIHWVIGKNGSGKSTFFKSIAGIVPHAGSILISGLPNTGIEAKKLLSYSDAEPAYPANVSAKDILTYINGIKKGDGSELLQLVETWGVDSFWNMPISTYSSGMLKKIGLISALIAKPKYILLDEPFILIDAKSCDLLLETIRHYRVAYGCSFLISSHQVFELQGLPMQSYHVENQTLVQR